MAVATRSMLARPPSPGVQLGSVIFLGERIRFNAIFQKRVMQRFIFHETPQDAAGNWEDLGSIEVTGCGLGQFGLALASR